MAIAVIGLDGRRSEVLDDLFAAITLDDCMVLRADGKARRLFVPHDDGFECETA